MKVRFTYLDDEPIDIWGTPNPSYGSATPSEGTVLNLDIASFGGPYVVVDDGISVFNLDLAEISSVA